MTQKTKAQEYDTFIVSFQGELIEAHSLQDALAIKAAGHVLNSETEAHYSPREVERAGEALARYGFNEASEALHRVALKMRAAQFLHDSVGYERPRGTRQHVLDSI